ncbi:DUF4080 domain-containing protein [Oscillospiraceae bacterium PP1C4]
MKVLLVAVNAKFSHTNLAVRYLQNTLRQAGIDADFAEYTINQPPREILADIVSRCPDRLLFSCYLWNIEYIRRIGADFRLLFPDASILLGGPEVSFDAQEQLEGMPWADAVLCGEGEGIIASVLGEAQPKGVYRPDSFVNLDELSFPYQDLEELSHRVLYYESTRGCPFGCSYCLSSADRTTRFRSLPLVYADLQRFLDARVMQVKFVDRTFNLDGARALSIWRYLAEHDNGVTSFQFELGGDLHTEEQLLFLGGVRTGLFQFEIGVQSTCEATLAEIVRVTDIEKLKQNVAAIQAGANIHQHLDLIAGLPLETFQRFAQSYDEVFAMKPEQLQLGFLKLLRGSSLYGKRQQYGLIHSQLPPYEILQTPQLSFGELARLKLVEEMTEVYYNSGRFTHQLAELLTFCPSPFEMFLALGERMPPRSVGKYEYYDLLFDFAVEQGCDPETFAWLMKLDLVLHERPRKLPQRCTVDLTASLRREIAQLGLPKTSHVEVFPFDVTSPSRTPVQTAIVCDYTQRDASGHALFEIIKL